MTPRTDQSSLERITHLFLKGPWKELMLADAALRLMRCSNDRAEAIAADFWPALYLLRYYTGTSYVLAVCRMFEQADPRYPKRTIRELLDALEETDLKPLRPEVVRSRLNGLGLSPVSISDADLHQ